MAKKLVATIGLPGSGKSWWADSQAKREGAIVVNKDDIRTEFETKGWEWSRENEQDVINERDRRIKAAFETGNNYVISSDTNFAPVHINRLAQLAKLNDATFETNDFTDVPLDVCIQRDAARDGKARVGEKVIRDMAEKYLRPDQLTQRTGEPQFFCDLDGVLADFDGFISKEFGIENNRDNELPNFWDIVRGYTGRLYFDMLPIPNALELWEQLKQFKPIILTGCPWSIPTAASDKREWVKKYIDEDVQVVCCKSRNKSLYLKPGDVLLDDWRKYQALWEEKGGIFVHYIGDIAKSIEEIKEAMNGK